jgi:hypothetical protein
MKYIIVLSVVLAIGFPKAECQVLKKNKTAVLNSPTLHWYGLDFSNTVIFDHTQLGKERKVKESVFIEWQAYFNKHVSDRKILRWFRKENLVDHREKFYRSHENLDVDNFIRGTMPGSMSHDEHVKEVMNELGKTETELSSIYNELSLSQLDSCIKSYSLDESDGLGAIMIVEKMSKADKGTYVVGVLFDIATRDILVAIRDKGAWDSYGFVAVYGSGINDGVSRIGDKYRRRVLRD